MKSPSAFILCGLLSLLSVTSCCDEAWWARRHAAAAEAAARVKSAPLHFLATTGEIWQWEHWRHIENLTGSFTRTKDRWEKMMRWSPTGPQVKILLRDLRTLRANIAAACSRAEFLTPEGRARLEAWQAKKWRGYPLPHDFAATTDPDIFAAPDHSTDTPQKRAEANFWAVRETLYRKLAEEASFRLARREDLEQRLTGPTALPEGKERDQAMETLRIRYSYGSTMDARLQMLYDESEKLHASWTAKNWEGYVIKEISSRPRAPIPLPGQPREPGTLP